MQYAIVFVVIWAVTFALILGLWKFRKWREQQLEKNLWDLAGRRVEKETTATEDAIWKGNRNLHVK